MVLAEPDIIPPLVLPEQLVGLADLVGFATSALVFEQVPCPQDPIGDMWPPHLLGKMVKVRHDVPLSCLK